MGKSAGKWIKTVIFGKKYSKSSLSKDTAKTPVEDLAGNSPIISDPFQFNRGSENTELEKGTSGTPCDTVALVSVNQGVDSQNDFVSAPVNDAEMRRQVQAATIAQAAFRGYLARRAFWALKGIIRLQALIRGHLVRRQAVATLRCMHAIVKVQALVRGRIVRLLDARFKVVKKSNMRELQDSKKVDIGANSYFGSEKLPTNAFVCKILTSLPIAIPLSLQYDINEPNSAWNWLERWSLSRFWQPPARTKKVLNGKSQRKQIGSQTVVTESGKSKRSVRKISTGTNGDNCALASFETDKPKRNPRKVTNHQTEVVQEHPQNELEKVKRNLRKVCAPVVAASEKSEIETEKPQPHQSVKTVSNSAISEKEMGVSLRNLRKVSAPVVAASEKSEMETEKPQPHQSVKTVSDSAISEKEMGVSPENVTDLDVVVDKLALLEPPSKTKLTDEPIDVLQDHCPVAETCPLENGEKMDHPPILHEELNSKEEQIGKENQKMRKRRSLPAKQEYPENISQNTPTLPSYMAATESVKAKLRAQGSSKFDEDDADYGFVRRHSLPASTNGKLSTLSPRIQKPVQANGKAGSKTSRLLMASKDDKVVQPGWRR